MKGVIFSLGKPRFTAKRIHRVGLTDIRYFFRRYGIKILFAALLFIGMTFGVFYAGSADGQMLSSLDFLFTTNLDARLEQSPLGTFCACFASDFIFIFLLYIFGFAPWGFIGGLFLVLFRGFGTGITAGYLYITHSLTGAVFYLLIILPGTFLFCLTTVLFSERSFDFSRRLLMMTLKKTPEEFSVRGEAARYSSRFLTALGVTFLSSLLDTALWTLFAGSFHF